MLEARTLMAGTPLSAEQAAALVAGVQALANAGRRVDTQAQVISQALPFLVTPATATAAAGPVSVGQLASLGNLFASTIEAAAQTYLTAPNPTVEGLQQALAAAVPGSVSSAINNGVLTYTLGNVHETHTSPLGLDLAGFNPFYNVVSDPTQAPAQLTASLTIPSLTLNLDLSAARFYINTPQVNYRIDGVALAPFSVNVGFLATQASGGSFVFQPSASNPLDVVFIDPEGTGQLDTEELNAGGTSIFNGNGALGLAASLPLHASLGAFETDPARPPTLSITAADVFGGISPPDEQVLNFQQVQPFNAITPGEVVDLITQVASALDKFDTSPALASPLPFVQGGVTVGGALDLGTAIQTTLLDNLTRAAVDPGTGGTALVPTFTTAQDLASQLATILHVPVADINPQFNPATNDLTFSVRFSTVNATQVQAFSVSRGDLGLELQGTQPGVSVSSGSTLAFTFGASLVPQRTAEITTSEPVPSDGRLTSDAHFGLMLDAHAPVDLTLPAAATADNRNALDLVSDLNSVLKAAGITSVVASLNTPNPLLLGGLPLPANGHLLGDAHFSLTLDNRPAVPVSVPASATQDNLTPQDLISDVNTALRAAGLTTVAARAGAASQVLDGSLPVPIGGVLSGDAHFSLDLPSTATTPAATIEVTLPQSATQNNTTPQELVAEFNTALQAAFQAAGQPLAVHAALVNFGAELEGTQAMPANGQLNNNVQFTVAVNGGTPVPVSISLAQMSDNHSRLDLVGDFNTALAAAGLTTITAGLDGDLLTLRAAVGLGINSLTLNTGSGDPMAVQLGFTPGQQSVTPVGIRLASDLSAGLRSLTLTTTATDPMATELGFQASQLAANRPSLVFYPVVPQTIRILTLSTPPNDPTTAQLGFVNGQSAGSTDGLITLATPGGSDTTYIALTAQRSDPAVSQLHFDDGRNLPTVFLSSRSTTRTTFLQGASIQGSVGLHGLAGTSLPAGRFGFLGAQVQSGSVGGTATVALQLKSPTDSQPGGRLTVSQLLAAIGPISTRGDLTSGSAVLKNLVSTDGLQVGQAVSGVGIPLNTTVAAVSGATVTLSRPATLTQAGVNLAFSNVYQITTTPTITGSARADVQLAFPGFADNAVVPLGIAVGNLADPVATLTLDTSRMGPYAALQFLNLGDVLAGLSQMASYLQAYSAFQDAAGQRPLVYKLPTVNRSVTQLLDYANRFAGFVDAVRTLQTDTSQTFQKQATELLQKYGLVLSFVPRLDTSGPKPAYRIDVGVGFNAVQSKASGAVRPGAAATSKLRFDLENVPGLVNLAGGAPNLAGVGQFVDNEVAPVSFMNANASTLLNVSLGFDLANPAAPRLFLVDGASLVTAQALASGTGLAFPVSFGKVGLFVQGGSAILSGTGTPGAISPATFTVGLTGDAGGRNYFDPNLFTHSTVTVAGQASVSLPVSLTPTTTPAQPPVIISVVSLAGLIDQVKGSVGPIQAPNLSQDYDLIKLIHDTPDLTLGLNQYLLNLQNLLNTQVYGREYPVVGTQLASGGQFLETFRVSLVNQLLNDAQASNPIATIQESLADIFGPGMPGQPGLDWLVDAHGHRATTPQEALEDVNVATSIGSAAGVHPGLTTPSGDYVNWNMTLNQPLTPVGRTLGFDVGLPALQMTYPLDPSNPGQNTIALNTGLNFVFNFGVNTHDGFYIDTTNKAPLTLPVSARPVAGQSLSGQFGYFGVQATPDLIPSKSGNPTEFVGTFTVGLQDAAQPSANLITYQDLLGGDLQINPVLQATGEIDLSIKTSSFGISTVFEEQWNFAPTDPDLSGSQPAVSMSRIGTNWAQSIADFLGPNLKRVFDFLDTGALGDILDFIDKPLPVVDYFIGNATTIDFLGLLASATGNPAAYPLVVGFFDVLEFLRSVYRAVPTAFDPHYDLSINQGSFTITQDLRTLHSLADIDVSKLRIDNSGVTPFIDQVFAYESDPKRKNFTTEQDGGIISGKILSQLTVGFQNASLSLPFFQDPNTPKLMLLGHPGDLIRIVTPSLGVKLVGQVSFPVASFGPLDLSIFAGGFFYPSLQFGFGYDTRGLTEQSASGDRSDLKDGFFFIADQTFLDLQTKFFLGVGAGVPDLFSVGIQGYLLWDNKFSLKAPDGSDKVYLDDFDGLKISGNLKLGGQVVIRALFFEKQINIYKPTVLFDYGSAADLASDPILARADDGVLRLNMGPDAGLRLNGDTSDGDENFTIRHVAGPKGNETVEVSAFGVTQTYTGISRIVGDGGLGNDTIDVQAGVLADVDLDGGAGDDRLIDLGSGTASLRGGDGNDTLVAGAGPARIEDESGNNTVTAGSGPATFVASGLSSYSLTNGALMAGTSVTRLGGITNVVLTGTDGDDSFTAANWSGRATFDGGNGFDSATVQLGGGGQTSIVHTGAIGRARVTLAASPRGGGLTITPTQATEGADTVTYPSTSESLTVNGGLGPNVIHVLGTIDGSTLVRGGPSGDTLDVQATAAFSRTEFDGGPGNDTVTIDPTLTAAAADASPLKGGLVINGGGGTNQVHGSIVGDLRNLLQLDSFAPGGSIQVAGSVDHALVTDGSLQLVSIGGSVNPLGSVQAQNIAAVGVGGSLMGTIDVAGSLGRLAVGGDLTGLVQVGGRLGQVNVAGATPGTIVAGDVGTVSARNATGPLVLHVREGGVDRWVEADPVSGLPAPTAPRFAYVYDSTGPGAPALSLRVLNAAPGSAPFDLKLMTNTAEQFNLGRLDAVGRAGLRNLTVDGSLLGSISPASAQFLGLPKHSAGGIHLPHDHLGAVSVRDAAAAGSVQAGGVQAVAFGALVGPRGRSQPATRIGAGLAQLLLRRGTKVEQTGGTFDVRVGSAHAVKLFLGTGRRRLDQRSVVLGSRRLDGMPLTARVTVLRQPRSARSRIGSIQFLGDGGFAQLAQPPVPGPLAGQSFAVVHATVAGPGTHLSEVEKHAAPREPAAVRHERLIHQMAAERLRTRS